MVKHHTESTDRLVEMLAGNGHLGLGLAQQPTEILDNIVCELGERQDLLSLGLTSKRLATIVFPRHIEYHTVSAPLHDISIWDHLIKNRACARNVRRLQVAHDSNRDHGCWGPTHFKVEDRAATSHEVREGTTVSSSATHDMITLGRQRERLLLLALEHMQNLRAFAWGRMYPPFITGGADLWGVLRSKPLLVDIRLSEDWNIPEYEDVLSRKFGVLSMLSCPLSKSFSGLARFEFQVRPGNIGDHTNIDAILDSLINLCPSLETLILLVHKPGPRPVAKAPIFQQGRWSNLTKLHLQGINFSSHQPSSFAMESFFTFHRKLSHLRFSSEGYGDFPHISLPHNSLPNLTSIYLDEDLVQTILDCPCSPQRRLREIGGLRLETGILEHSAYHFQGVDKDEIRSITVTGLQGPGDVQRLATLFPGVECLDLALDFDMLTWDDEAGKMRVILISEWAEKISDFRNLRVLHGVPFFSEDEDAERAEVIDRLAMLLPELEWFSVPDSHPRVDIIRSPEGVRWRVA